MNNKVFYHSLHRELWQWLGDNPEKSKWQWKQWTRNGGLVNRVASYCFACDYANSCNVGEDSCPLDCNGNTIECLGGLYSQWDAEINPQERTRLAYAIRDLAVKDGVVCE